MDDKKIFMGGGALIAVLVLIALFVTGSDKAADEAAAAAAAQQAEAEAALAAVSERLAALESQIAEVSAGAVAPTALDELRSEIAGLVDNASAETGALSERIEGMAADLDAQVGSLREDIGAATAAAVAAAENAVAPVMEDATAIAQDAAALVTEAGDAVTGVALEDAGIGVGQTALFADGAVRAFVSRIGDGSARLVIGGETRDLRVGEAVTLPVNGDFCRVTLDAAQGSLVALSALCGADLPAPAGMPVGRAAIFADGALRVFVSRVDADAARLSINGTPVDLRTGATTTAMAGDTECQLRLNAVDRGHAAVSALCGDDNPVSARVMPGAATVLGEGAARVFVTALDGDTARFAINGQTVQTGATGDSFDTGDGCVVTVEATGPDGARFSYLCP